MVANVLLIVMKIQWIIDTPFFWVQNKLIDMLVRKKK